MERDHIDVHADDGGVCPLNEVHGQLTVVFGLLVRDVILRVELLRQGAPRVLFLPDHPGDNLAAELLSGVGPDAFLGQFLPDDVAGITVQEHLENAPDHCRLVLLDDQLPVPRPVTVNLEAAGIPALVPLADAPLAVFQEINRRGNNIFISREMEGKRRK